MLDGFFLNQQRLQREAQAGIWPHKILTDYVDQHLQKQADATAFIGYCGETDTTTTLSFAELAQQAGRITANLSRLGIGKGDVVAFQLPNWWQFVALHLACLRIGAISNPLMPIFRQRELQFMLGFSAAKVLIVPQVFRGFDHQSLGRELLAELPGLEHVFIIDGDGDDEDAFENGLLAAGESYQVADNLTADDVIQLLYTSGTTGEPKGVLHTSNTLLGTLWTFVEHLQLGSQDVVYMPSPMAHQSGFIYGMVLALAMGVPLLASDIWQPAKAAELIERHGATYLFAATPFLADLAHLPGIERFDLTKLRLFVTAGAPIPPPVVDAARERLGVTVVCGWGMTECGLATATLAQPQDQQVMDSDGLAVRGFAVRVVNEEGQEVPRATEGNLQIRGSGLFVGYLKRPHLYDVDADGWFNSGDIARMDAQGYIRLIGRNKDIIIRGGENIPVQEIENLLYQIPALEDVAIVAMPDQRLGEKACAFITLRTGQMFTLAQLTDYLEQHKVAKQYWPERLEVIAAMPRTPSGKIQKFQLREQAKAFAT